MINELISTKQQHAYFVYTCSMLGDSVITHIIELPFFDVSRALRIQLNLGCFCWKMFNAEESSDRICIGIRSARYWANKFRDEHTCYFRSLNLCYMDRGIKFMTWKEFCSFAFDKKQIVR